MVINPRSDSSESCFHVLNPKVNSLAKKKSQQETPCTSHFFGMGLQSENFGKNHGFFWLRKGQFWNQISRDLFGICSGYTYSFERFLSQLFAHNYKILVQPTVFIPYSKLYERIRKNLKFSTLMDQN